MGLPVAIKEGHGKPPMAGRKGTCRSLAGVGRFWCPLHVSTVGLLSLAVAALIVWGVASVWGAVMDIALIVLAGRFAQSLLDGK